MTLYRAEAEALHEIRTRVRQELEDHATDPNNNAIPAGGNEFADLELDRSINDELKYLALRSGIAIKNGLTSVELEYTTDADGLGMALPAAVGEMTLAIVEYISGDMAIRVHPADPSEIEFYQSARTISSSTVSDRLFYCELVDPDDAEVRRIKVRPSPGPITLRLWYVATPIITSDDGDLPLLSARWADLIALGAARRLLRRSGRVTSDQNMAYDGWITLFDQHNEGEDRIRFPAGRGL